MASIAQLVGLFLSCSVVAGVAAAVALKGMLSGYMIEKGKNQATREDFAAILEQLKISTREAESIRTELSGLNWMRQQYWGRREQYYMELLAELTKLQIALADGLNHYSHPDSVYDDTISESGHYKSLMQRANSAYLRIQELAGPAAVFLSESSVKTLSSLIGDYWEAADISSNSVEFLNLAYTHVDYAYAEILSEAKKELAPENRKTLPTTGRFGSQSPDSREKLL